MAIGIPSRLYEANPASDPQTSGILSPAANALIIVIHADLGTGGCLVVPPITTTITGISAFTQQENWDFGTGANAVLGVYTATTTASPSTGTISVNSAGDNTRKIIWIYQITGINTTSPIIQEKRNQALSTGLAITFDNPSTTSSLIFAVISNCTGAGTPTITPGSGYNELHQSQHGHFSTNLNLESMYKINYAGTTVDWSALFNTGNGSGGVALEVAVAQSSDITPAVVKRQSHLYKLKHPFI